MLHLLPAGEHGCENKAELSALPPVRSWEITPSSLLRSSVVLPHQILDNAQLSSIGDEWTGADKYAEKGVYWDGKNTSRPKSVSFFSESVSFGKDG